MSPTTEPTPTSTATRTSGSSRLDALDDALAGIRRAMQRPGYRRRLLEGLTRPLELGTLRLLRAIQRGDEPPSIGTVATTLAIDPSTASRVVDRAVAAGYVARQACTDDRRRARLALTDEGVAVLDEVTSRRRELLAELTADWDLDRIDDLVELLTQLQEGFEQLGSPA